MGKGNVREGRISMYWRVEFGGIGAKSTLIRAGIGIGG